MIKQRLAWENKRKKNDYIYSLDLYYQHNSLWFLLLDKNVNNDLEVLLNWLLQYIFSRSSTVQPRNEFQIESQNGIKVDSSQVKKEIITKDLADHSIKNDWMRNTGGHQHLKKNSFLAKEGDNPYLPTAKRIKFEDSDSKMVKIVKS